ncbi:hypothetical protein [Sphingosinicella sp. CPCC 101087]|uniref:hypothetical protein n=1 Tax=Sphingosinicella sp. CPCC 101087 TaxID=2497754 RepID=UPI00101C1F5D|nr:hypothetical protein [Sphingosinicella sp. CPCC 101087]
MNPATLSGGRADRSMTWGMRGARMMGWASFGLAAAFVLAPERIARTFGLEGKENLIRAFGAQELLAGMGSLSVDAAPAMWSRAAGDVVHIGTLATALRSPDEGRRRNVAIGLAALVGFLAVDTVIAARLGSERSRAKGEQRDYSDRSGFPKSRSPAAGGRGGRQEAREGEPVPAQ